MQPTVMHIAITINERYLVPACVMLTSLFENNRNSRFHIHIIADFNSVKLNLVKYIINKYNSHYTTYFLDETFIQKIAHFKLSNHAQLANYYRLFITEIIDEKIEKILYLDTDIIICTDIAPLYTVSLDNNAIAAASSENTELKKVLGIPDAYLYFNSGVLLMNLNYFRENNLVAAFSDYLNTYPEKIMFWDQDVLNALLYNKRIIIDGAWNAEEKYIQQTGGPVKIIHYTGSHKPWHFHYNTHPLRDEYFVYLKKNKVVWLMDKVFTYAERFRKKLAPAGKP